MLDRQALNKRKEELMMCLDQSAAHHNSLRGALTEVDNMLAHMDKMVSDMKLVEDVAVAETVLLQETPDKCA